MANPFFAFPIRKGMADNELLEILKNNVAGETRQQLQEVLQDSRENVDYTSLIREIQGNEREQMKSNQRSETKRLSDWLRSEPAFKVLDADPVKNIALVSKLMIRNDMFGDVLIGHDYYLVGISDEMKLFMHPLNGCNPNRINRGLTGLFEWMNRSDWGFKGTDRMQGDIMMRVVSPDKLNNSADGGLKSAITVGPHAISVGKDKILYKGNLQAPTFDGTERDNDDDDDGSFEIESNHNLKTDGRLFQLDVTDNMLTAAFVNLRPQHLYVVTGASAVVLEHPEHQTKSLHVPKGQTVVIARQRGENFTTPRALD